LKINYDIKIKTIALCVLATALTASWSARAETIFLKCGNMDTITVDLTKNTVNNQPANITPIAIDWDYVNKYGDVHYHIDRTAGTLRYSGTYYTQNGDTAIPQSTDPCTFGSPPTKF
jgi:hypothetical protein